ncbi:MAG: DUF433 domain-containing protein [Nitrospinae bacterium]|nr:DUF433 domain-containing protein [Nitrospinota bacterium]
MSDTLIERNPEILGGTPVFAGTRVPVRTLMEHLEAGDRLDDFLEDFPTVSREQALERAQTLIRHLHHYHERSPEPVAGVMNRGC